MPNNRNAADLAALLETYFFARTDHVAVLAPWGKPHPAEPIDGLTKLLRGHLGDGKAKVRLKTRRGESVASGQFRIGSYVPAADGTTPWLCLDFDGGKDHADALVDPLSAAKAAMQRAIEYELPAYLERSGGGAGWHVWVFFEPGIAAADARRLGGLLAPQDAMCTSGRMADVRSARGIEIFPKQVRPRKDGFGNMVWLPFWHGAAESGNRFYRIDAGEPAEYTPDRFDLVTPAALGGVLASVSADIAPTAAPAQEATVTAGLDAGSPHGPAWKAWRERALAALPLESVYGAWLTGGRSGEHWYECRDPDSPSGDQDPSAGVAIGTGEAERGSFHSFRTQETISVFDFMVRRGVATDFRAAVDQIATLSGVPLPEPRPSPEPKPTKTKTKPPRRPRDDRPEIRVNGRQLLDVIQDAWRAVHKANHPPAIFRRGTALVRLRENDLGPFIEEMGEAAVFGLLARVALWVRVTQEAIIDVDPVKNVARDMIVNIDERLQELDAVVTTPVFGRNGHVIVAAGYHEGARLYYRPSPGLEKVTVPERPTQADVAAARALILDELLVDFPFVAESDRAHAVAALILPFVRRIIHGPTPLHLVEAPTPGSGKSLLAEVVAAVAAGRAAQPMTLGREEEENRKRITAALSRAQPVMLIDNVRVGIDSSVLAQVLTSTRFTDRVLGQSRMIDLPNDALWIATANNPRLSLEIARRSVRVRLDPKCDRPWQGRSFKHERLIAWSRERRPDLVAAVLTLVSAWIAAGAPPGPRSLGSFESWAETIGGVLAHAGIPGFLDDLEELYELADAEGQEWRTFVAAWAERHGNIPVAAGILVDLAVERGLLGSVIGDGTTRSQRIRMGKALLQNRDRQFGEWRIVCRRSAKQKQHLWQLACVDNHGDDGGPISTENPFSTADRAGSEGSGGMLKTHYPPNYPPQNTNDAKAIRDERVVAGSFSLPTHMREDFLASVETHVHARIEDSRGQLPATTRLSDNSLNSLGESGRVVEKPLPAEPCNYPPTTRHDADEAAPVDLADFDDLEFP